MGGKGSGGARIGAGRKPKALAAHLLHGTATARARTTGSPPPVEPFPPPVGLPDDVRAAWLDLAPHAFTARTLTPATAYAFTLLCRNIVLERALATAAVTRGGPDHRALIQRLDIELARFCLAPIGKALWDPVPATEDPFAEFDRGVH
jgi:hypothetical protein